MRERVSHAGPDTDAITNPNSRPLSERRYLLRLARGPGLPAAPGWLRVRGPPHRPGAADGVRVRIESGGRERDQGLRRELGHQGWRSPGRGPGARCRRVIHRAVGNDDPVLDGRRGQLRSPGQGQHPRRP